jgi:hypothetical protein
VNRRLTQLRALGAQLLHRAIQQSSFIAVVILDDRMLAARYRRHYTVSIKDYRWDARQLRRRLAKLNALLWCDIRRYDYLCGLHFDD